MTEATTSVLRFGTWLRAQPDRPFVITFAHACVVILYASGHGYSSLQFRDPHARQLITSAVLPAAHGLAAAVLIAAILIHRWQGSAAGISLFVWGATTASLFFVSYQRIPPAAYWSVALSLVITVAAFLMLVRWGVDGDDRGTR